MNRKVVSHSCISRLIHLLHSNPLLPDTTFLLHLEIWGWHLIIDIFIYAKNKSFISFIHTRKILNHNIENTSFKLICPLIYRAHLLWYKNVHQGNYIHNKKVEGRIPEFVKGGGAFFRVKGAQQSTPVGAKKKHWNPFISLIGRGAWAPITPP